MPSPLLLRRLSALRRRSSPHSRLLPALISHSPSSASSSSSSSSLRASHFSSPSSPSFARLTSPEPSISRISSTQSPSPVSVSHWPSVFPSPNRPLDTSAAAPLVDSPIPSSSQSVTCQNATGASLPSPSVIRPSSPFIGSAENQSLSSRTIFNQSPSSQPLLSQAHLRLRFSCHLLYNSHFVRSYPPHHYLLSTRGFASDTLLPLQIEASDNRSSHSESSYNASEAAGNHSITTLNTWDRDSEPQERGSGFERSQDWVQWRGDEAHAGSSGSDSDGLIDAAAAVGAGRGGDATGAVGAAAGAAGWLGGWAWLGVPVDAVTQMVSSIQATTGAHWWLTLIGSTLALRLALFPLTWHQMSISSQLAALGPKLPPPFPLPGSGMTWQQAWALRQRRRKQLNAPSALWLLAAPAVQIPLFFTWIFTMRHMALSAHPGFDVGGCLWFEDLTAFPQGVLGWVFPLFIAGSFYSSLQVMMPLHKMGVHTASDKAMLAYRTFLEFLTLPTLYAALNVPQAVHVYWLTNNTFTLAQALALRSPTIRQALGLPTMAQLQALQQQYHARAAASSSPAAAANGAGNGDATSFGGAGSVGGLISEQEIARMTNPHTLLLAAAQLKAAGSVDLAACALRRVLEIDQSASSAWLGLGQMHSGAGRWVEAAECFSQAINHSKERADVAVQLAAHLGAGVALAQQSRPLEAKALLQVAAETVLEGEQRRDPLNRRRHAQAMLALASLLSAEGNRREARKWVVAAADYDPSVLDTFGQELEGEGEEEKGVVQGKGGVV